MKSSPSKITLNGKTVRADTCGPLVRAAQADEVELQALSRKQYPGMRLDDGQLPGLLSVGYWDAHAEQSWGLPAHRNEGLELTYLENGSLDFWCQKQFHSLEAGDLTVTRPWQSHAVGSPKVTPGRLHFLIIDLDVRQISQTWKWPDWLALSDQDLHDLTTYLSHNEHVVWPTSKEVGMSFKQLASLVKAANQSPEPFCQASRLALLLSMILLDILSMFRLGASARKDTSQHPSASNRVAQFLDALKTDLTEAWTVEEMALSCGLARTRFAHFCKRLTNRTPIEQLNYLRIKKAKQLIESDFETTLTEIGFQCGFTSSQYFSTTFKKHAGMSPREFRSANNSL